MKFSICKYIAASATVLMCAITLVAGSPVHAQGTPLPPGGIIFLSGDGSVSGTLEGSITTPLNAIVSPGSTGPSGTFTSQVYIGDTTNPFGLTGQTFVETINAATDSNPPGSGFSSLSLSDFANTLLSVGYAPTSTSLDIVADGVTGQRSGGTGNNVTFGYGPTIAGSQLTLVLYTNSLGYQVFAGGNVQNGGPHTVKEFVPGPAPEPASCAAFGVTGLGLLALALRARRVRNTGSAVVA